MTSISGIDAERTHLVARLRRLADALATLPIPDLVEPLTVLRDDLERLDRRSRTMLPPALSC